MKTHALMAALLAAFTLTGAIQAAETGNAERARKDRAEAGGEQSAQGGQALASRDEKFVKEAAQGGQAEVTLGEMAKDKGQNPEVKKFGELMTKDHSKANSELKQFASKRKVSLPEGVASHDQATVEKLSKLSGPEFDKAYIGQMVKDHRKDVSEFERNAKSAEDPELKSWAEKTLPTLREHLNRAETIERDLNQKKGM